MPAKQCSRTGEDARACCGSISSASDGEIWKIEGSNLSTPSRKEANCWFNSAARRVTELNSQDSNGTGNVKLVSLQ